MSGNTKGVYKSTKKDGTVYYRSSITYHNKHISLGSYEHSQCANEAYIMAGKILSEPNIKISDYTLGSSLDFHKWVILINFRDNNYYITAPVYLYPKYFEYYIEPDYILKFSIDDLFYYSKKKIMKRGNHLFVADYGMQINIQNRYGIRSHAVAGRDYIFKNGDSQDFRYENIKIINPYFGVTSKMTKNGMRYTAKIHVVGNYTIGTYQTEEEAAIAYNKAIDILKNKGVKKNFTPNYLESLKASEYANIYSKLVISEKILNYHLPL